MIIIRDLKSDQPCADVVSLLALIKTSVSLVLYKVSIDWMQVRGVSVWFMVFT